MDYLPAETVREIFLHAVRMTATSSPFTAKIPLNISHVCRTWRDLSISYANLWSNFSVLYSGSKDEVIMDFLDTWLERSGTTPLTFQIYINLQSIEKTETRAQNITEGILSRVFSHQKRWCDASFHLHHLNLSSSFQIMEAHDIPLLTSLDWYDYDCNAGQKSIFLRINNPSCLSLRRVSLCGYVSFVSNEPIYTITGESEFSLEYLQGRAHDDVNKWEALCLEFLRIAPNIVEFYVSVDDLGTPPSPPPSQEQPVIVLEKLRKLSIGDGTPAGFILSELCTPSLDYLKFCAQRLNSTRLLFDLIRRSLPPLTYLDISPDPTYTEEADLLEALRLLPTLRTLRVLGAQLSIQPGGFIEAFTIPDPSLESSGSGRGIICPALEKLSLHAIDIHASGKHAVPPLCSLIVSRWRFSKTFAGIKISLDSEEIDWMLVKNDLAVQKCIQEGLFTKFRNIFISSSESSSSENASSIEDVSSGEGEGSDL